MRFLQFFTFIILITTHYELKSQVEITSPYVSDDQVFFHDTLNVILNDQSSYDENGLFTSEAIQELTNLRKASIKTQDGDESIGSISETIKMQIDLNQNVTSHLTEELKRLQKAQRNYEKAIGTENEFAAYEALVAEENIYSKKEAELTQAHNENKGIFIDELLNAENPFADFDSNLNDVYADPDMLINSYQQLVDSEVKHKPLFTTKGTTNGLPGKVALFLQYHHPDIFKLVMNIDIKGDKPPRKRLWGYNPSLLIDSLNSMNNKNKLWVVRGLFVQSYLNCNPIVFESLLRDGHQPDQGLINFLLEAKPGEGACIDQFLEILNKSMTQEFVGLSGKPSAPGPCPGQNNTIKDEIFIVDLNKNPFPIVPK